MRTTHRICCSVFASLLVLASARLARAQGEPTAPAPVAAPPAAPAPPAEPKPAEEKKPSPSEDPRAAPFSVGDFTWQNGQSRQKSFPLSVSSVITPSIYLDVNYSYSFNHPKDDTLTGSAAVGRHNELQINLASIGLEWNFKNVIGRISLQYGSMLNIIQDLDGTVARGRSLSAVDLSYIREATLGYHFDVDHGLNVEAGIFMSYIGLESYLLAENWNYNRSMVCDFTPFYFQGVRVQYFPKENVKIEPWLMNGFQSYGKWNYAPSGGVAFRWAPSEALGLTLNTYVGTDTRGQPDRVRFHSDHSVLVRYYNAPESNGISKAAFTINNHAGFEGGGTLPGPGKSYFLGTSIAHRIWFHRDLFALSLRAEALSEPGRYMLQFPPPGFDTAPGKPFWITGLTGTLEFMPRDYFGIRAEVMGRYASEPFFAGPNGTTSPDGFRDTATDTFVPDVRRGQLLLTVAANFRL